MHESQVAVVVGEKHMTTFCLLQRAQEGFGIQINTITQQLEAEAAAQNGGLSENFSAFLRQSFKTAAYDKANALRNIR
jgi:hypothetical protein